MAASMSPSKEERGTFPASPAAGFISTSSKETHGAPIPRASLPVSVPDLIKKGHERQEHEPAEAHEPAHVCTVPGCSKNFASAEHLERHVLSLHTAENRAFPFHHHCNAKDSLIATWLCVDSVHVWVWQDLCAPRQPSAAPGRARDRR